MHSNGNLTPEKRTDKNGVTSVRWVRPKSGAMSMSSLPAPSPGKQPNKEVDPKRLENLSATISQSTLRWTRCSLSDFNPDALEAVEAIMQEAIQNGVLGAADDAVHKGLNGVRKNIMDNRYSKNDPAAFAPFNNVAVFGRVITSPDAINRDLGKLLAGLRRFSNVEDFLHGATDDGRAQAVALVTVASRISEPFLIRDWERGEFHISNGELSKLIMERPADAERIAAVVTARGTDDADLIRSILETSAPSLAEGIL